MKWEVIIPESYIKQNTMPMDRAKIEALRKIAEQLEITNNILMDILHKMT